MTTLGTEPVRPGDVHEAGHGLARRAVELRLEKVPFEEAVSGLLASRPDWQALQVARDHLAHARFEAPLLARSDALALIDAVLYRLEHPPGRWRPARRPRVADRRRSPDGPRRRRRPIRRAGV
jgi:hypothetical protein